MSLHCQRLIYSHRRLAHCNSNFKCFMSCNVSCAYQSEIISSISHVAWENTCMLPGNIEFSQSDHLFRRTWHFTTQHATLFRPMTLLNLSMNINEVLQCYLLPLICQCLPFSMNVAVVQSTLYEHACCTSQTSLVISRLMAFTLLEVNHLWASQTVSSVLC